MIGENLNLHNEIFQLLIESSSEGILAYDKDLKITIWNKTMESLTEKNPEQCIGQHIFDIFPHLSQGETRKKFYDTLEGQSPVSENSIFSQTSTGEKIYFTAKYFPIRNHNEIEGGLVIINDITDKTLAHQQLDLLKQTIKTTFESTPYDYWMADAEGTFLLQNKHSIKNFGDLKGKKFDDISNRPELLKQWHKDLDLVKKGESVTREVTYEIHGENRHLYVVITPVKHNQKVLAIIGLSMDITHKKEHESRILKSEHDLKMLLENSPDIIVRIGKDLRINFINKVVERETSQKPEFFIGKTYHQLNMSSEDANFMEDTIRWTFRNKIPTEKEWDFHGPQGIIKSFSNRFIPEFSSNGEVESVLLIATEITRLKNARNELEENQKRLSGIMANIPGAVFKCKIDNYWTMEFISEGVQELTGYSVDDLVQNKNLSFEDLIVYEDKERVRNVVNEALGKENKYLIEYRILTKNGKRKWVWEQGRIFKQADENVSLEGVIIDITERKDFEDALKKSKIALKKTNEELETYIYKASHDLRGPLASILGLAMVAQMEVTDEQALKFIDLIKNRTQRLNGTLTHFLDIVKVKQRIIEQDRINTEDLIDEVLTKFKDREDFSRISIHKNLPSKDIESDVQIIEIILQNLIENSIEYKQTFDAGPEIKIDIRRDNEGTKISVEDNGIGINEDIKDKIFTMFYRGNDRSVGSGLGLYIVKIAVEKLGGTILVESEVNKGSKFFIFLPSINKQVK